MKKMFLFAATVLMILTGCSRNEMMDSPLLNVDEKTVIVASFEEQSNSRMAESEGVLSWDASDEFVVFSNNQELTFTTNENDAAIGKFTTPDGEPEANSYAAYYPIENALSFNGVTLTVKLAAEYTSATSVRMPMWGKLENGNVSFKHLGAALKFTYKDIPNGYTTLVVEASVPISGGFTANLNDESPILATTAAVTNENKKVKVTIQEGEVATFYVPLPVGTYDLKVYAQKEENETVALKSWTNLTIARKGLYSTSATYVAVAGADTPAAVSERITSIQDNSVVDVTGSVDATANNAGEMTLPDVDATYNFAETPTTSQDKPLIFKEANDSQGSNVKFNMPGNTSGLYAEVNTPHFTVSLEGGTYTLFASLTDVNTLIVGKGTTINKLNVIGGNVRIEKDAVVNSITRVETAGKIYVLYEEGATLPTIPNTDENIVLLKINADGEVLVGSLDELRKAIGCPATIKLTQDIENVTEAITIASNVTIDGGGHKISSDANRVILLNAPSISVTLNKLTIESEAVRNGTDDIRGISTTNNCAGITLTLNNCKVDFTNDSAHDWSYGLNQTGVDGNTIVVNGGSYEGANAINVWGNNHTITINDATLTSLYQANESYVGACVRLEGTGVQLTVKNTAFNGNHAVAISEKNKGQNIISESGNTDNTECAYVAEVGSKGYLTLKEAVTNANNNTVKLLRGVTLTESLSIPSGYNVTLDLNEKTISQEKECTAHYEMIKNQGTLTITGNGKISFKDTSDGDPNFGWGSYTIGNYGTLVVENGTIEHLGEQNPGGGQKNVHMYCAIQQGHGAVSTTINYGKISTPTYRSIRINTGALIINDGIMEGQVWLQPNQGDATISVIGGDFSPRGNDGSSIFLTNQDENHTVTKASFTGGTFNTKIGASNPSLDGVKGSITGGIFTDKAKNGTDTALLADGYTWYQSGDDEWSVFNPEQDGISNSAQMFAFADMVNNRKVSFAGKTVELTADIYLNDEVWTPIGQTGATTFNGIFDGQGYTIYDLNVNSESETGANYSSGLFGWVESHSANHGHIKNVKIVGAKIVGHHNCGALVGYITQETALVENCHVTKANVSCTNANNDANGDKAGALIGNATVATLVKNCTAANSTVSAGRDAGQVIGVAKEANVTGCSATNVTVTANGTGTGANIRNEVIGRLLQ